MSPRGNSFPHRLSSFFPFLLQTYATALFGSAARRVIEQHDPTEPLFLYLAWNAVHNDLSVPADFLESTVYRDITRNITDEQRL